MSNRTEIGADLMSNRTEIGTDATNRTRLTEISAVPDCTEIGADPIPQLTEIGVVPDRTEIGADYIHTIAESSGIMRMLHARANRTGRVLIKKVFNDEVV
jgi:hypothetical protein